MHVWTTEEEISVDYYRVFHYYFTGQAQSWQLPEDENDAQQITWLSQPLFDENLSYQCVLKALSSGWDGLSPCAKEQTWILITLRLSTRRR